MKLNEIRKMSDKDLMRFLNNVANLLVNKIEI